MLRQFVDANVRASRSIERRLPEVLTVDGNGDFPNLVREYLRPSIRVYDIGGGKQPFLSADEKHRLGCCVTGIDISGEELSRAPAGTYDRAVTADIASYRGSSDADLVICRAVLEHVGNVEDAFRSIASVLKPGGVLVLFAPCRNAAFARLNLILPESLKRRILFSLFPAKSHDQGFPAHYDRCTPSEIAAISRANGLRVQEVRRYYASSYFSALVPLYGLWRLWTLAAFYGKASDLCETFTMALVKE